MQSEVPIPDDVPDTAFQAHLTPLTHSLGQRTLSKDVDANAVRG